MRVVQLLGRSTGGIGTHVADLSRVLRELGDDVTIVTDPITADRFGLQDARLWWPRRSSGVVGSLRDLGCLRRLASGADVLHAHGRQAGLLASLVTIGLPTPVVLSQHNALPERRGARGVVSGVMSGAVSGVVSGVVSRVMSQGIQRFVAHRAALVTGASSDLVDEARRHGARAARLAPVPSPRVPGLLARHTASVDDRLALVAELLEENGIEAPRGTPLVLTIARIAPQKDLRTLVDAAAILASASEHEVRSAPPVWVVVGGGDETLGQALVELAATLRAPVHFVGAQPDPERWLRAADVFALSSRWEARALVVQEAMAAGTPVVGTDVGGLRDLLEGAGLLVPAGDAAALGSAVGSVLDDPQLRKRLSDAGRERAGSWDDAMTTARRWRQWYTALPSMT